MYLYILSKNTQDENSLWQKTKSEYKDIYPSLFNSLDSYISSSGKKNQGERIMVSSLIVSSLINLLEAGYIQKIPQAMKKSENGKPYFEDFDLHFNIAHSEDMVAVAYSKDGNIGVDIEGEIKEEIAEKLEIRFPKIAGVKAQKSDTPLQAYIMNDEGKFLPLTPDLAEDNFTAKWTIAEAIMKCFGGGFSALPSIEKMAEEMQVLTFIFEAEKNKNYISIAMKKQ